MRSFKYKNIPLFRNSDLMDVCNSSLEKILNEKAACKLKGSEFIFLELKNFKIIINKYVPLRSDKYRMVTYG